MPEKILLSHGSGGALLHGLIKEILLKKLDNPILRQLSDSAYLDYREKLAFTTDSFVVSPIRFPGGDIGKLSVCGTINDLVAQGAVPEYLSLAIILEEGFPRKQLVEIVDSIAAAAKKSNVRVVTGDFKVVEKGACDQIFINTSGLGRVITGKLSVKKIAVGDKIIISGDIGQHGFSVFAKRQGLNLGFDIKSDCAALNGLIIPVLKKFGLAIKFMRDPTRGGLATTLNEAAEGSGLGMVIEERDIPISQRVRAASELLGIDPLYTACEGRMIIVAEKNSAKKIVSLLRQHPLGQHAQIIGEVVKVFKGQVILKTVLGTERIIDMLSSDPLPRIC